VKRWLSWLVLCGSGCSLLFDPSGVVAPAPRDAFAASDIGSQAVDDLSVVVEDLAVPPDQAMPDLKPPPDLERAPDLEHPDLEPCVPPVFLGFRDGGSVSPLDCNQCGCLIDALNDTNSIAEKFGHGAISSFSESVSDAGLTLTGTNAYEVPGAGNGNQGDYDYYNSPGRFYLDGDFDLELDYHIITWPSGAHLQLYALGPPADMALSYYSPEGIIQIYDNQGADRLWLYVDARTLDVDTTALTGTMRIRRTGNVLCASVLGHEQNCHTGTSPARPFVQIELVTQDSGCGSNCFVNVQARLSRMRLLRGSLVDKP
jgi:hypothetical protein